MQKLSLAIVTILAVSAGTALARGGSGAGSGAAGSASCAVVCNLKGCNTNPVGVNPHGPYYPGPFEFLFGAGKSRNVAAGTADTALTHK